MELALVYMAAGMSSRFGGKAKQLAVVGPKGETLIEYSMKQALPAGFTKIIFIVGEKTEGLLKQAFGNNYQGIPIFYPKQTFDPAVRDKPWGTADALVCAKEYLDCPFVVCNGDDLYGENAFKALAEHLKKNNEDATLGYQLSDVLPDAGGVSRAIFQINGDMVVGLKETHNITKNNLQELGLKEDGLCSMNIFALHESTLKVLDERVNHFKKQNAGDRKIECYLPEEMSGFVKSKKIILKIYPIRAQWVGITNPGDEETVRKMLLASKDKA